MERVRKDPGEVNSWGFHWARTDPDDETTEPQGWLQGSTLVSSEWDVEPTDVALGITDGTNSTQETQVQISGGQPGRQYRIKNTVVSSAGATGVRSLLLTIANS